MKFAAAVLLSTSLMSGVFAAGGSLPQQPEQVVISGNSEIVKLNKKITDFQNATSQALMTILTRDAGIKKEDLERKFNNSITSTKLVLQVKDTLISLTAELKTAKDDLATARQAAANLEQAEAEVARLNGKLAEKQEQSAKTLTMYKIAREASETVQKQFSDENARLTAEIDQLTKELKAVKDATAKSGQDSAADPAALGAANAEIDRLKQQLDAAKTAAQQAEKDAKTAQAAAEARAKEVAAAEIQGLRNQIVQLEQQLAAAKEDDNKSISSLENPETARKEGRALGNAASLNSLTVPGVATQPNPNPDLTEANLARNQEIESLTGELAAAKGIAAQKDPWTGGNKAPKSNASDQAKKAWEQHQKIEAARQKVIDLSEKLKALDVDPDSVAAVAPATITTE